MRIILALCFIMTFFLMPVTATCATSNAAPGDWITIGNTNGPAPAYSLLYYKFLQLNADTDRYESIYEVSVQADANFFNMQGTYRIRVDKHEWTTGGRFDGMEIKCISGNPGAASFYIYNNALWLRSNYLWGIIVYRTVGDWSVGSPLNTSPFSQTTTAPTGYLTSTASSGMKCDFDNNKFYPLSYEDVYGNVTVSGKLGAGTVPAYALHTVARGNTNDAAAFLWGENYGVAVGTQNASASNYSFAVLNNATFDGAAAPGGTRPLFYVRGDGNVGIGTFTPQAKLAVNGDLLAKKVRVTQTGWADFVFHPDYQLPGLQQVEEYITLHRHLPDIPAAEVVEKEGLDVAEISKKMMQKIEELTLYIIKQDKKMAEQDKKIAELTKEMRAQVKVNAQLQEKLKNNDR
ncbi:hypothetical protein [Chitinophaga sp. 212800010-3]|uniref:hypothetical protein n=1 Tax=unclassified Chitinophaga TaxID=2619133 RepID=UPI002DF5E3E6|nr:Peptidase S74 domain-containing protein [Chitinophaga sp. 212800010-3]